MDTTVPYELSEGGEIGDLIDLDSDAEVQNESAVEQTGNEVAFEITPDESLEAGGGYEDDEPDIEVWDGESSEETTVLQFEGAEEDDESAEEQTDEVSETVASTSTEFYTPTESPANLSSDSSSEEEGEAPRVFSARRSHRLRRGRNYLTYEKMGEPKISRYTMLNVEHKPPRILKP